MTRLSEISERLKAVVHYQESDSNQDGEGNFNPIECGLEWANKSTSHRPSVTCKNCIRYFGKEKTATARRARDASAKVIKRNESPWLTTFSNIRQRCLNPTNDRYSRYGGRGIKALLTAEELKFLWYRDGAKKMKQPSIDRINNDGHYEIGNCRYIENAENAARGRRKYYRCGIDGCGGAHVARGMCTKHYQALAKSKVTPAPTGERA